MPTSVFFHGFGIQGYHYVRSHFKEGKVIFPTRKDPTSLRCPCCNDRQVIRHGETLRFQTLPIANRCVYIILTVLRVECRPCVMIRQVAIVFAEPRRTYTKTLLRYALGLSPSMTLLDVARHLGVSWDVVKDI